MADPGVSVRSGADAGGGKVSVVQTGVVALSGREGGAKTKVAVRLGPVAEGEAWSQDKSGRSIGAGRREWRGGAKT